MKLRHTNHRNAQFYNFFKKNNNNIFWANVRVSEWWGKTNKYKNHIASVQTREGNLWMECVAYIPTDTQTLSLSLPLELFISCNNNYIFIFIVNHYSMQYKKEHLFGINSSLVVPHTQLAHSLLASYCVTLSLIFLWNENLKKKFCWNYYFWNIFKLQVQR